jgi:predicted transcriptional regulator
MVNNIKNNDFTLAVANLAAAAMANNPGLSMVDAVNAARATLRGTNVSAQQIADSVQPDKIQCLEDGTWHVMLRRYLKRRFNMTPEQYRAKWDLPDDYPFVAPNYARVRSKIAKKSGLGHK